MTEPQRKIILAVTHLLGVGHFARMVALGKALNHAGWQVTLLSGGRPVPNIDVSGLSLIQMPPVHCRNGDFSVLLDDSGQPVTAKIRNERAEISRSTILSVRPDVLVTELYPFGRRALASEYEALIEEASTLPEPPAMICSIRDVLNPPSKPGRSVEVLDRLARYDAVIIHGTPRMPLERSWPVDASLARMITYVGYLRDETRSQRATLQHAAQASILVSAGGSDAGMALNRSAIEAAALLPGESFHVLVSHAIAEEAFGALHSMAPANALVERARPDFPQLLVGAALSISQAGYNTVLDLAAAGTRAILVPFSAGSEQEQTIRAEALQAAGLAQVVRETDLSGPALVSAVRETLAAPPPDWSSFSLDGGERAATAIGRFDAERRAILDAWKRLDRLLESSVALGRRLSFWIRDDDATADVPALRRFLTLLENRNIPGALAVIPAGTATSLQALLVQHPRLEVLQHGYSHANHSPRGEKSAEFGGHRSLAEMEREIRLGRERLEDMFGGQALPVFVPPWNRISPAVAERLPALGLSGLSTFGTANTATAPSNLVVRNTHWDPIDWRGNRGLRPRVDLLTEACGLIEAHLARTDIALPPIGVLTHHLQHDGWIHAFLDQLVGRLKSCPQVDFLSASQVFAPGRGD
ncbi:glycosyltransferase [Rhabdaerophilum sp. SD176]|uniref:glycosyltransferase n=1 Tax=Rhabdaerophilum sp. SD176 TaxID=2983548 RepID=UPI0024DFFC79|nr:glycosyltransferase [Rhabdaerophilum sp. SD176]